MADDIVTRLRRKYANQLPICAEAGDEIERLRTEVARLNTFLHPIGTVMNQKVIVGDGNTIYQARPNRGEL